MHSAERRFDRLELLALAWLGLPLLVWVQGWLQAWAAGLVLALLALSAWGALRGTRLANDGAPWATLGAARWGLIVAVAVLWVAGSGLAFDLGLPWRMNDDWHVRLTVLRDLSLERWPVGYAGGSAPGGQPEWWLRCPMLLYLLPALVGQWLGLPAARLALVLQLVLGVALFFALALKGPERPRWRQVMVLLALWVMFSGMDLLGHLNADKAWPRSGEHIEWWYAVLQYSSHTTQLYWAPNHALPGWLAAAVLWRHRQHGLAVAPMALLVLLVAAQAPLVAIGLAPLAVVLSFMGFAASGEAAWRTAGRWLREALHPAALATLPVAALLAAFYTFGHHGNAVPERPEFWWLIPLYLRFAFIEWATLALLLLTWRRQAPWWWACVVMLAVLPFFQYGPGNDIVMRGGTVALALMALAAAEALCSETFNGWRRAALLLVLALGAVTPLLEMQRAAWPSLQPLDDRRHFMQQWGEAGHYVGKLKSEAWLRQVLREPVPAQQR